MTDPPRSRRERREAARELMRRTIVRPAKQGDFGSIPTPPGSTIVITQLAPGIRHKVLIKPDGPGE